MPNDDNRLHHVGSHAGLGPLPEQLREAVTVLDEAFHRAAVEDTLLRAADEIERLVHENTRLREAIRVLDGFVGRVPTRDEWTVICSMASRLGSALAA